MEKTFFSEILLAAEDDNKLQMKLRGKKYLQSSDT